MSSQRSSDPRGNAGVRLPPVATSFVGRDAEVGSGADLLADDDLRALTLTGPGGVGKTRLALAIAERARGSFPDGVVFVPLAAIRDPALVISTIAQRLDLPDQVSHASHTGLTLFLRERRTLLVLDNVDQVVEAAADIGRLLDACPALRAIVTSRTPLSIDGEREFAVSSLPVPEIDSVRTDSLADLAAVELFIERATDANASLQIGDDDRPTLAEICRLVDGFPLAIELAAARCRSLTVAEIAARLADRSPRAGSAGDTIAWSYDLLDRDQRLLFRRLSVFNGGFSPEAAGALCDDLALNATESISSLIESSLVRRVERANEPERWRQLETVREFALGQLESSGEGETARRWHASYFASIASEAEDELVGSEQVAWLAMLEREHDNLRAALDWSIARGEVGICLKLGSGIWRFWERRGHVGEGLPLLARVIDLARSRGPSLEYASALFGLGRLRYVQGEFALARAAFLELVDVCNALDSDYWLSGAYTQLSHVATREGDYLEARRLCELGLMLRRRSSDTWGTAISLLVLGRNAHYLGDDDRATQLIGESIEIFRQLGDPQGMSDGYDRLGEFALQRGKFALARGHIEQALTHHQELGDDMAIADSLALLGYVAIGQRNYNGARSLFTRSLTRLIDVGARWRIDPALEGLAEIAIANGDAQRAVRILAAADRTRSEARTHLDPNARDRHERNVAAAREALGGAQFDAAWQAGAALAIDQVSAEALEVGQTIRQRV